MSDNVECTICTDFYSAELGDSFSVTECGHMFHKSCITSSLSRRPNCPTCRKFIPDLESLRGIHGVDPNRIPMKFTITTLGDAYVGKTGLVRRFTSGAFNDRMIISTVVADFTSVNIEVGGDIVKLYIQDTGGDYNYKAITPQYIRNSYGIIIAYDCHRWSTLQSVQGWLDFANEHAPEAEKILIGCRSDLEWCVICEKNGSPCRKPTKEEIQDVVSSLGLFHVTTSAKTAYCVDVAFRTLASRIMENNPLLRHRNNYGRTIKLHEKPPGTGFGKDGDGDGDTDCWDKMGQWFRKIFGIKD